ncbi:hypothetical protein CLCR_09097 [Cladophialophora carrionii]|uniref:Amidase domain-containing protein n=1 Tax=Cladophialophora carrionii TaxID=86049 RepID=A0A1C1CRP5_9EURO|nr:hypothetical protein CLCR_09097 [Cladophialophora carrionii]
MAQNWQQIASTTQETPLNCIPKVWRLPQPLDHSLIEVRSVPRTRGLRTEEQLDVTEQTASEQVARPRDGKLSSAEINCLTAFFPDEALSQKLDGNLAETGKPVDRLHGLPVGNKDIFHIKDKNSTMGCGAWHNTQTSTSTRRPIDCLMSPAPLHQAFLTAFRGGEGFQPLEPARLPQQYTPTQEDAR